MASYTNQNFVTNDTMSGTDPDGAAIEPVDLDAGLLGEVAVKRIVGLVVACRVQVKRGLLCHCGLAGYCGKYGQA